MERCNKIKLSALFLFLPLLLHPVFSSASLDNEPGPENADNPGKNKYYSLHIDQATIARGYTVSAFGDSLKLSLVPGILSQATRVDVLELREAMELPWSLGLISGIYQFEFANKAAYDDHKPFYIQFAYSHDSNNHKQVFFYDNNYQSWRPLPTRDFPEENFVRSLIHLPFARIAVFEFDGVLTAGRASWYAYKGGNYAASPDFPKGSRLRVHNRENGRFVDVEINDYGPDRSVFPDRAIDLDKAAFARLGDLSRGMLDIKIEPLRIASANGEMPGVEDAGIGPVPRAAAKSYIIYDENENRTILSHNATATLPLASLTKLVAIKVYLGTKPDLSRQITYSDADEAYNHEYCKPWESARLRVKHGDILTAEDLLYASLVGSANNTIETLVRASGLARPAFIKKMNDLAAVWGAAGTKFFEPTGLSPENVSSALDYAIITAKVFEHPIIQKASIAREYEFTTINTGRTHKLKNTNQLIRLDKYNITGSKTGYLDEALYCLMTRVAIGDKKLIIVAMGTPDRSASFSDMEKLIKYGIKNL